MALPSGTHVGTYEVLGPLGAGGMGEVYRAPDVRLGREIAIKRQSRTPRSTSLSRSTRRRDVGLSETGSVPFDGSEGTA
jgi:serine/threonine protein kinase